MSRAPNPSTGSRKISFNVSEQYDIQDVVGEGAYGVVWWVDAHLLPRYLAIEIQAVSPHSQGPFLQLNYSEIRLIYRLYNYLSLQRMGGNDETDAQPRRKAVNHWVVERWNWSAII